jgi:superfamily II DNA or RNA helicase
MNQMVQEGLDFYRDAKRDVYVPRAPLGQELRPYQQEAVQGILEQLKENRSTLLVLPTGGGKTRVFTEVAHGWKGRVLILAHRDELLQQARDRISKETGEMVGLEQAQWWASDERIIVGSVQTMSQPDRLARWKPDEFSLVVVDESHHATAPTYRRVLDHFGPAKVLGVTATPDRADERAMGQVFESVAYCYEIEDAISDGWLCPILVRQVYIGEINLSACRTTAGDLNQGDLDAAMAVEEALHGVVKATLEQSGDRKTLAFTTSVENAKRIAEIFNRYRPACARSVDGKTPMDERRAVLAGFSRGDFQYLVNCAIATEGYDCPQIGCIAMARPTKSRALFAQMVGRGLRTSPGKSDCLVLEFTGNTGKHRLASSCDILGGRYSEDEVDAAESIVRAKPGIRADEALAEAREAAETKRRQMEAARRARVQAQVQYTTRDLNPFSLLHIRKDRDAELAERFGSKVATDKQIALLTKWGADVPRDCTSRMASKLIASIIKRRDLGLASFKQVRTLSKAGVPGAINISFDRASAMITEVKRNGWRCPPPEVYERIMGRERQPGEDG